MTETIEFWPMVGKRRLPKRLPNPQYANHFLVTASLADVEKELEDHEAILKRITEKFPVYGLVPDTQKEEKAND